MATPVHVPTPLRSYTDGRATVEGRGTTVADLLADLETRHRGMRFRMIDEQDRIRRHIRIFVNDTDISSLEHAIAEGDTVTIICAISGGVR